MKFLRQQRQGLDRRTFSLVTTFPSSTTRSCFGKAISSCKRNSHARKLKGKDRTAASVVPLTNDANRSDVRNLDSLKLHRCVAAVHDFPALT